MLEIYLVRPGKKQRSTSKIIQVDSTMDDPAEFIFSYSPKVRAIETSATFIGTLLNLGLVLILVFLNGFFVRAEFAFVAVRRSRIETLAAEGKAGAIRLLTVLNNMKRVPFCRRLGVTIASLGLGWVGDPLWRLCLNSHWPG